MLVIREFSMSDLKAVTELMADLGYPVTVEQMKVRLETIQSNPMYGTYLAELAGVAAGFIGVRLLYGYEGDQPVAQISALVTKSEYRGMGIGTRLVQQAETWAKQNGAGAVVLTSGNRPEREAAHRFYQQLGYTMTGVRFSKRL